MDVTWQVQFIPELELLFAAQSIVCGGPGRQTCADAWGEETLTALERRYPLLMETSRALTPRFALWACEPLLDYPLERFTLADYEAYLLDLPQEQLIYLALCLDFCPEADLQTVREAMTRDDRAAELLSHMDRDGKIPFLAFRTFLRQTEQLVRELIALAEALDDDCFRRELAAWKPRVDAELQAMHDALAVQEPLVYSEQRMGKTFRNRGPYVDYWFLPTLFLPYRACRFSRPGDLARRQILLLNLRPSNDGGKQTVRSLKAMADEGRYRILTLLASGQSLRGLDIAKTLKLAPSTVSHHMEQLRQAGLLHEEPLRDGKYYSLNRPALEELLTRLGKELLNN